MLCDVLLRVFVQALLPPVDDVHGVCRDDVRRGEQLSTAEPYSSLRPSIVMFAVVVTASTVYRVVTQL